MAIVMLRKSCEKRWLSLVQRHSLRSIQSNRRLSVLPMRPFCSGETYRESAKKPGRGDQQWHAQQPSF